MKNSKFEELKKVLSVENDLSLPMGEIIEQLKIFEKGIPPLKLLRPCTIGDGIKLIPEIEMDNYINIFAKAVNEGKVLKFVPASGAATRMFKKLLSIQTRFEKVNFEKIVELSSKGDEDGKASMEFFNKINHFAFYDELKNVAVRNGKILDDIITNKNISELINLVIDETGLNYVNLPKGCIPFHAYPDAARTAFEEHLIESMHYVTGKDKIVKIHFTISMEHEDEVKSLFETILNKYRDNGWKFNVSFSFQNPSTDTISVTMDNKPLRDENGKIVFRPGGHGALLTNLNELKADIIFIKNIDNIVPDHLKDETYKYKKILGGYLSNLQQKVFGFIRKLDMGDIHENIVAETLTFIKNEFDIDLKDKLTGKEVKLKSDYLLDFLNRPIRVCGMVKREDHPGGSPFWVINRQGEITKQIVETNQVDMSDPDQHEIFNSGTHFNPVDLACGIKDYKGNYFNLEKFSNPETGLISKKSKDGVELKALELPGLWNGGMYYWLTVFVEVPKITFNPVKEVNDLLKPEHQPLG